jgi:hypothetical protein
MRLFIISIVSILYRTLVVSKGHWPLFLPRNSCYMFHFSSPQWILNCNLWDVFNVNREDSGNYKGTVPFLELLKDPGPAAFLIVDVIFCICFYLFFCNFFSPSFEFLCSRMNCFVFPSFCYLIFVLRFFFLHVSAIVMIAIYNIIFSCSGSSYITSSLSLLPSTSLCSVLTFSRPTFLFSDFLPALLVIVCEHREASSNAHVSCSEQKGNMSILSKTVVSRIRRIIRL